MKVAFDVKGTIEGYGQDKVLRLYRALQKMGHEMYVWSNSYSYAVDANKKHDLNAWTETKFSHSNGKLWDRVSMDLAIEDDRYCSEWMATKAFIFVDVLPDDIEAFAAELDKAFTLAKSSTGIIEHPLVKSNT